MVRSSIFEVITFTSLVHVKKAPVDITRSFYNSNSAYNASDKDDDKVQGFSFSALVFLKFFRAVPDHCS